MRALEPAGATLAPTPLSFWLGLLFIALGSFTSGYSARQYSVVLRTLSPVEFPQGYAARWGMAVNAIISLLGLLLIGVLVIGAD